MGRKGFSLFRSFLAQKSGENLRIKSGENLYGRSGKNLYGESGENLYGRSGENLYGGSGKKFIPNSSGRRNTRDKGDVYAGLADFAGAVADDDIDDFGLVSVLGGEFLLCIGDEGVVELVLDEVDGAAAEAAAHDAGTCHAVCLGYVVEVVEFLTAYLIVLGESLMGEVHLLAYFFIVALDECIAYGEDTVFLSEYEGGTLYVFCAYICLYLLKVFPCAVAKCLYDALWMAFLHRFCNIFTRVAAVVVRRACEFVLHA